MLLHRFQKQDRNSIEDLGTFLKDTRLSLQKVRQCFLSERSDASPIPIIDEALRDVELAIKSTARSSNSSFLE